MKNCKVKSLPLVLFWLLGIIWGSNFIYMKWASDYITTSQIVLLRAVFGFIPVALYSMLKQELKWWHLRHSLHFFIMSLIATTVYYYGFAKGSELLLSGVAGALSGAIPLFSFVVALIFLPEEKLSALRTIGVSLGFIGVLLIANPFATNLADTNIAGVLYMAMGSLSVGVSFIYAKKFISPLKIASSALVTYQLGFAVLTLLCITDTDGLTKIFESNHVAIGTVLGLGILGTGAAYVIYYFLIETMGAVSAASATYIPPVVALVIGAVFVGENISIQDYFSVAIILAGVVLLNKNLTDKIFNKFRKQ